MFPLSPARPSDPWCHQWRQSLHCWRVTTLDFQYVLNSLWHNDAIWRHISGSALVQVISCCLTAPSHYLNQCRLLIMKFRSTHMSAIAQRLTELIFCIMSLKIILQNYCHILQGTMSFNSSPPSVAYTHTRTHTHTHIYICVCHWTGSVLVQVMACRLFGAKPLPEPMLVYCQLVP